MAKFTITGLDDVQEALLRQEAIAVAAVPEMLEAGGEVMKGAFQAETSKLNSTGRSTGALTASIKVSAVKERNGGKYIEIADRKEAIAYCMTHAKPGDMIVLLGKGHEDYQEIKGVKYHFDEREAVAEILDEIKSGERTVEA